MLAKRISANVNKNTANDNKKTISDVSMNQEEPKCTRPPLFNVCRDRIEGHTNITQTNITQRINEQTEAWA